MSADVELNLIGEARVRGATYDKDHVSEWARALPLTPKDTLKILEETEATLTVWHDGPGEILYGSDPQFDLQDALHRLARAALEEEGFDAHVLAGGDEA